MPNRSNLADAVDHFTSSGDDVDISVAKERLAVKANANAGAYEGKPAELESDLRSSGITDTAILRAAADGKFDSDQRSAREIAELEALEAAEAAAPESVPPSDDPPRRPLGGGSPTSGNFPPPAPPAT